MDSLWHYVLFYYGSPRKLKQYIYENVQDVGLRKKSKVQNEYVVMLPHTHTPCLHFLIYHMQICDKIEMLITVKKIPLISG